MLMLVAPGSCPASRVLVGAKTQKTTDVGQRRRRWSNIKTALGLVGVVSYNQFSR